MKHHTAFEYLGFGFGKASPFHGGTFFGKPVFFRHGHGEGHGSAAKLRLKKFVEVLDFSKCSKTLSSCHKIVPTIVISFTSPSSPSVRFKIH